MHKVTVMLESILPDTATEPILHDIVAAAFH